MFMLFSFNMLVLNSKLCGATLPYVLEPGNCKPYTSVELSEDDSPSRQALIHQPWKISTSWRYHRSAALGRGTPHRHSNLAAARAD
jgi:hypothetical protein